MKIGNITADGRINVDFSQAMMAPKPEFLKYNDYSEQFNLALVRTSTGEIIEGKYVGEVATATGRRYLGEESSA